MNDTVEARSVSADGRYVAFTDWSTGNLMLRDLVTNADRIVVNAGNPPGRLTAYADASVISRDGRQVAYSWFDDRHKRYELWLADLSKSAPPRQLYSSKDVEWLEPRDWSPDGKWIAALTSHRDLNQKLALISVQTSEVRPVKTGRWPGGIRMFFSPDGKQLAYDFPQANLSAGDVWISTVDGTSDSRVVANRGNDVVMGWSPDGSYLLFTTDLLAGRGLFALPLTDGVPNGKAIAIKADMGFAEPLGVTANGSLFTITRPARRAGSIQVGDFDSRTGRVTSARDVSADPAENNVNPSWAHDGKYLAYVSQRGSSGTTPVLVVRSSSSGGLQTELQPRIRGMQLAGWSADDKSLLVTGADSSGRSGAFRVDIESGSLTFVFETPSMPTLSLPAFSVDDRELYYWRRLDGGAGNAFIKRDLRHGIEKELIRRPFLGALLLSPNGRLVVTETVDPVKNERLVLLVPTDGATPRELMRISSGVEPEDLNRVETRGARLAPVSWMPDSRSVVAKLQHVPGGASELWEIPVDGSRPRKLDFVLEPGVFAFRVSPDARRVAYRTRDFAPAVPSQLWSFTNFLPR